MTDDPLFENPPPPLQNPMHEDAVASPQASSSETVKTHPLPEEFKALALRHIQSLVAGNGVNVKEIAFQDFNGNLLEFQAITKLSLKEHVQEKKQPGKLNGPEVIANATQLKENLAKHIAVIMQDPQAVQHIKDFMMKRDDRGCGLQGEKIDFPFLQKDYVIHDPCQTCRSKGQIPCQRCHATGFEMCPQCQGQGKIVCKHCQGSQFISTPQGRTPCNHCHGQGRENCSLCQSNRKIQCSVCKTKRTTPCNICNGQAWNSILYHCTFHGDTEFLYDREAVERECGSLIDDIGAALGRHAVIEPQDIPAQKAEADKKEGILPLGFWIKLKHADFTIEVKNKPYQAKVYGEQAHLMNLPDIITDLIAPGKNQLQDAAQRAAGAAEKIRSAGKYKTVKHAILAAARLPLNKAAMKVKKANPHGISNAVIGTLVKAADQALNNATRQKRKQGLIFGALAMIALYAGYLLTPLRAALTGTLSDPMHVLVLDGCILMAGTFMALGLVSAMSKGAMKSALRGLVPVDKLKTFRAKKGAYGQVLIILTLPLFLGMCEIMHSVPDLGAAPPWWYTQLRQIVISL